MALIGQGKYVGKAAEEIKRLGFVPDSGFGDNSTIYIKEDERCLVDNETGRVCFQYSKE